MSIRRRAILVLRRPLPPLVPVVGLVFGLVLGLGREASRPVVAAEASATTEPPALELVETFPIETELDHPDLPEAHVVWREMFGGATATIDLAEFYASNSPGSRLEEIVVALEDAALRGVRVRFLSDETFSTRYPRTLERLGARDGIEVLLYDAADTDGVLHAKYFLVDGREAFLGSQNFDWRALTHIQELGVRIREPSLVAALADVFESDWARAAGTEPPPARGETASRFPVSLAGGGDPLRVTPAFSPRGLLPDEALWDLPQIVHLLDAATDRIRVQLLSYRVAGRDGARFDELESALRRAAERGVAVQLLLADWNRRPGFIGGLQDLQRAPGIEIRLVTIPPWSGGFLPHARVIHAKYLVVDGRRAWLGTSNWAGSYFYRSRNVGLVMEGDGIPARLDRFFEDGWESPYAVPVDPDAEYTAPRIAE